MFGKINFKVVSDALFMGSNIDILLIGSKKTISFAAQRSGNNTKILNHLIGKEIENLLTENQLVELDSNSLVCFEESLNFLNITNDEDVKLNFEVIKTEACILIKATRLQTDFKELLPRIQYFSNMVKTHFEDHPELSNSVIGAVIQSESNEISKELERFLP